MCRRVTADAVAADPFANQWLTAVITVCRRVNADAVAADPFMYND